MPDIRANGLTTTLPLDKADQFQVYNSCELGLAAGDKIRVMQNGMLQENGKRTRVNNGAVYDVAGFASSGDLRIIGPDDGTRKQRKEHVLPRNYSHLDYAYTDTSFASQGKTASAVFIAVGNESLPAANQQQWYVSVSCGRDSARVYVDSKEDVQEAIQRSGVRMSATELVRENNLERFARERNRVLNYLKQKARDFVDRWRKEPQKGQLMDGKSAKPLSYAETLIAFVRLATSGSN
jgi:hypothetical protein